jgi:MFS family permease
VTAGLVSSVPLLAGGLMQLVSLRAIRKLGSHKRWVLLCAVVQALSFIPFVWAALTGGISTASVLLVATVYWGVGLATGPAWNTWMGTVVPRNIRARFFAHRTRLSQAAVFFGFLAGGAALHLAEPHGHVMFAFAALFAAACLFRLISVVFLAVQTEPVPIPPNMKHVPVRDLLRQFRHGSGGQLLFYIIVVQGAVQFSGPYFTPFMFEKLHLTYGEYVVLIAASFLTKVILLPTWGHYAHRAGAMRLLWIGGIGIVPVSGMWLVSDNFVWLLMIQLFGGVVWAAYELAFFLLFFESIPQDERTSVLTLYNLANTAAWVGGSLLGGAMLYGLGAGYSAYLLLFALSSVGRAGALLLLRRISPIRVEAAGMGVRTVGVRPSEALLDAPILPSLPDEAPKSPEKEPAAGSTTL